MSKLFTVPLFAGAVFCAFTQTVNACPELAGKYKQKGNEVATQVVTQSVQNGIKVYHLGEGARPIVTDGQERSIGQGVSLKASCSGDSILLQLTVGGTIANAAISKTASGYKMSSSNPGLMPDIEWIKE